MTTIAVHAGGKSMGMPRSRPHLGPGLLAAPGGPGAGVSEPTGLHRWKTEAFMATESAREVLSGLTERVTVHNAENGFASFESRREVAVNS